MIKITEIITQENINIKEEINNKEDALRLLVELASKSNNIMDKESVLNEVLDRENIISTGIGSKIAIPHAKSDKVKKLCGSLLILKKPVDFDSLDGEDVNLIFMILSKDDELGLHLKILSKISRILHNSNFKQELIDSKKSIDVIRLFDKFEENYGSHIPKRLLTELVYMQESKDIGVYCWRISCSKNRKAVERKPAETSAETTDSS